MQKQQIINLLFKQNEEYMRIIQQVSSNASFNTRMILKLQNDQISVSEDQTQLLYSNNEQSRRGNEISVREQHSEVSSPEKTFTNQSSIYNQNYGSSASKQSLKQILRVSQSNFKNITLSFSQSQNPFLKYLVSIINQSSNQLPRISILDIKKEDTIGKNVEEQICQLKNQLTCQKMLLSIQKKKLKNYQQSNENRENYEKLLETYNMKEIVLAYKKSLETQREAKDKYYALIQKIVEFKDYDELMDHIKQNIQQIV